jgi:hypothetical protein
MASAETPNTCAIAEISRSERIETPILSAAFFCAFALELGQRITGRLADALELDADLVAAFKLDALGERGRRHQKLILSSSVFFSWLS